ncbi:MAG: NYN domain-containing protein [Planctomycetota bacterium]
MPVIIDGNNLLYAARDAEGDAPLVGRSILCDTVGGWALRRGERVRIIFDGPAPSDGLASQIGNSEIQVSYSGSATADAALIEILETDSAARRLLVVSSDREIMQAAKRRRARSVRSNEFWALMKQDLSRPLPRRREPEEKEHGLNPRAAEQWLREFGLEGPDAKPVSGDK